MPGHMSASLILGDAAWQQLIIEGAAALGVSLTLAQTADLAHYAHLLLMYNQRLNLTRITEPRDMALKHFVDSLAAIPHLPPKARLLDMGSGAGFPGMVLKVALPNNPVVLVDSRRKKVHFLQHLIRELHLQQVLAEHSRIEDPAFVSRYRQAFDVITARAVSSLPDILRLAEPLLAPGGRIVAYKGPGLWNETGQENVQEQIQPGVSNGWTIRHQAYHLVGVSRERLLVIAQKTVPERFELQ